MKTIKLESVMPLMEEAFDNQQSFTIPVTGQSMRPTMDPLDSVTLRRIDVDCLKVGDVVLYRRENGQFVLHRVVKINRDTVDFCGDAQVEIEHDVPKSALIAYAVAYKHNSREMLLDEIRKEGRQRLKTRRARAAISWWCRKSTQKTTNRSAMTSVQFVGSYLKKYIPLIILLCVLSGVIAASMIGMAMASGRVIDKALSQDMQNFSEWFIVLFMLLVCTCISNLLYSQLRIRIIGKLKNEIREDLVSVLLTKQYSSVQQLHSGDILNRLTNDIQIVVENAVTIIPQTVSLVTKLLGGIGFMLFVDPIFTAIVLVGGSLMALLVQLVSHRYKRLHKECQEIEGETRSYLQECIENLVVVKSFSNEKGVLSKLHDYHDHGYRKQVQRGIYSSAGNTFIYSAFTFSYYAALAWGVLRIAGVIGAAMQIGTFVTLLQIMEQIRSPFRAASGIMPQYYAMLASAERLQMFDQLPAESKISLPASIDRIYQKMDSISFNQISFSYSEKETVFESFDLTVKKEALTVLVGASGSGKTTLIKLLLGLITPQKGSIVIKTSNGDIPVNASSRAMFAYVPQGNMVLSGTIAENISFGNKHVNRHKMMQALETACLLDTVVSLPNGLDTVIGERGVGLSEGQIQRVAVARALLSEAPILLMDECTSALDLETERQLIANLKALKDRTVIFISHREAVLESADEVFDLKQEKRM